MRIEPQAGFQTRFSGCSADIAVAGSGAGVGKTHIMLMEAARWHKRKGYQGVIFRRESTDLTIGGGLWDEASKMYPLLGARLRAGAEMDATWTSGARVQFRGMQKESDMYGFQGAQFAFVGFDEATHFTEAQVWYLWSRCRSTCGVKPYMRLTCNPDPDSFLFQWVLPWIDVETGLPKPELAGRVMWITRDADDQIRHFLSAEDCQAFMNQLGRKGRPISLAFLPGRLDENRLGDPDYAARLEMMDRVQRARLLGGSWTARYTAGSMFQRGWFDVLDQCPPADQFKFVVRGFDRAGSADPKADASGTVKIGLLKSGGLVFMHADQQNLEPGAVTAWQAHYVKADGRGTVQALWQDPGQAGKDQNETLTKALREAYPAADIRHIPATKDKVTYASILSAMCDPQSRKAPAYIVRAPWNEQLLTAMTIFPNKRLGKIDLIDAASRAGLEVSKLTTSFASAFMAGLGRQG
jgi:predicted phage terminase large subunit-like protein